MLKNQKGFALVEIIVVVLTLTLIGGIGSYILSQHKAAVKTTITSHSVSQPVIPNGWLTYKSTHTSVRFSYPSNWKITHGQEAGTTLENVTLTGTNGFSMQFFLEKQHPLGPQNYMCTAPQPYLDTFLNDNYSMVLEGTKDIFLLDNSTKDIIESHCGVELNIATPQTDFTFYGSYANSTSASQSADAYMKLSEIQTAKKVFSTFVK